MVKHFVFAFAPNAPQHDASKEVPNLNHLTDLVWNSLSKHSLLPIEPVIIACLDPAKFMHNERGPSPCPPGLNAVPNFMLDRNNTYLSYR